MLSSRRRIVIHRAEALYNPFQRPPAHAQFSIFRRVVLPLTVLFWLILLLYLPYFRVSQITYGGLRIIRPAEIEQAISERFWQGRFAALAKNYFFVREAAIAKYLEERFALAGVDVNKVFPDTINIVIEEKISSIIYDDGKNYFLLAADGTAIKQVAAVAENEFRSEPIVTATSTALLTATTTIPIATTTIFHVPNNTRLTSEFGNYPIVYFSRGSPTSEKQTEVLRQELIAGFIDAYTALQRGRGIKINYFSVDDPAAGAIIHTNKPWRVLFEPAGDIAKQINNVNTVLRNNRPAEYIDVRFGERVYWR